MDGIRPLTAAERHAQRATLTAATLTALGGEELIVVEQLQAFLVEEGVGQMPRETPSTSVPSIWLLPRQGAPMPRTEGGKWLENVTITLDDTNVVPVIGVESWLEDTFLDVIVRARNAAEAKLTHRVIKALLHPVGEQMVGKADWTMGELRVLYSSTWRGERDLPLLDGAQTYDRAASFRFRCARSDM